MKSNERKNNKRKYNEKSIHSKKTRKFNDKNYNKKNSNKANQKSKKQKIPIATPINEINNNNFTSTPIIPIPIEVKIQTVKKIKAITVELAKNVFSKKLSIKEKIQNYCKTHLSSIKNITYLSYTILLTIYVVSDYFDRHPANILSWDEFIKIIKKAMNREIEQSMPNININKKDFFEGLKIIEEEEEVKRTNQPIPKTLTEKVLIFYQQILRFINDNNTASMRYIIATVALFIILTTKMVLVYTQLKKKITQLQERLKNKSIEGIKRDYIIEKQKITSFKQKYNIIIEQMIKERMEIVFDAKKILSNHADLLEKFVNEMIRYREIAINNMKSSEFDSPLKVKLLKEFNSMVNKKGTIEEIKKNVNKYDDFLYTHYVENEKYKDWINLFFQQYKEAKRIFFKNINSKILITTSKQNEFNEFQKNIKQYLIDLPKPNFSENDSRKISNKKNILFNKLQQLKNNSDPLKLIEELNDLLKDLYQKETFKEWITEFYQNFEYVYEKFNMKYKKILEDEDIALDAIAAEKNTQRIANEIEREEMNESIKKEYLEKKNKEIQLFINELIQLSEKLLPDEFEYSSPNILINEDKIQSSDLYYLIDLFFGKKISELFEESFPKQKVLMIYDKIISIIQEHIEWLRVELIPFRQFNIEKNLTKMERKVEFSKQNLKNVFDDFNSSINMHVEEMINFIKNEKKEKDIKLHLKTITIFLFPDENYDTLEILKKQNKDKDIEINNKKNEQKNAAKKYVEESKNFETNINEAIENLQKIIASHDDIVRIDETDINSPRMKYYYNDKRTETVSYLLQYIDRLKKTGKDAKSDNIIKESTASELLSDVENSIYNYTKLLQSVIYKQETLKNEMNKLLKKYNMNSFDEVNNRKKKVLEEINEITDWYDNTRMKGGNKKKRQDYKDNKMILKKYDELDDYNRIIELNKELTNINKKIVQYQAVISEEEQLVKEIKATINKSSLDYEEKEKIKQENNQFLKKIKERINQFAKKINNTFIKKYFPSKVIYTYNERKREITFSPAQENAFYHFDSINARNYKQNDAENLLDFYVNYEKETSKISENFFQRHSNYALYEFINFIMCVAIFLKKQKDIDEILLLLKDKEILNNTVKKYNDNNENVKIAFEYLLSDNDADFYKYIEKLTSKDISNLRKNKKLRGFIGNFRMNMIETVTKNNMIGPLIESSKNNSKKMDTELFDLLQWFENNKEANEKAKTNYNVNSPIIYLLQKLHFLVSKNISSHIIKNVKTRIYIYFDIEHKEPDFKQLIDKLIKSYVISCFPSSHTFSNIPKTSSLVSSIYNESNTDDTNEAETNKNNFSNFNDTRTKISEMFTKKQKSQYKDDDKIQLEKKEVVKNFSKKNMIENLMKKIIQKQKQQNDDQKGGTKTKMDIFTKLKRKTRKILEEKERQKQNQIEQERKRQEEKEKERMLKEEEELKHTQKLNEFIEKIQKKKSDNSKSKIMRFLQNRSKNESVAYVRVIKRILVEEYVNYTFNTIRQVLKAHSLTKKNMIDNPINELKLMFFLHSQDQEGDDEKYISLYKRYVTDIFDNNFHSFVFFSESQQSDFHKKENIVILKEMNEHNFALLVDEEEEIKNAINKAYNVIRYTFSPDKVYKSSSSSIFDLNKNELAKLHENEKKTNIPCYGFLTFVLTLCDNFEEFNSLIFQNFSESTKNIKLLLASLQAITIPNLVFKYKYNSYFENIIHHEYYLRLNQLSEAENKNENLFNFIINNKTLKDTRENYENYNKQQTSLNSVLKINNDFYTKPFGENIININKKIKLNSTPVFKIPTIEEINKVSKNDHIDLIGLNTIEHNNYDQFKSALDEINKKIFQVINLPNISLNKQFSKMIEFIDRYVMNFYTFAIKNTSNLTIAINTVGDKTKDFPNYLDVEIQFPINYIQLPTPEDNEHFYYDYLAKIHCYENIDKKLKNECIKNYHDNEVPKIKQKKKETEAKKIEDEKLQIETEKRHKEIQDKERKLTIFKSRKKNIINQYQLKLALEKLQESTKQKLETLFAKKRSIRKN